MSICNDQEQFGAGDLYIERYREKSKNVRNGKKTMAMYGIIERKSLIPQFLVGRNRPSLLDSS